MVVREFKEQQERLSDAVQIVISEVSVETLVLIELTYVNVSISAWIHSVCLTRRPLHPVLHFDWSP